MPFWFKYLLMSIWSSVGIFWSSPSKGLRVLMYHSINFGQPSTGDDLYLVQWNFLKNHLMFLLKKKFIFKKNSEPWDPFQKTIAITFDDGFFDNFEVAKRLSLLKIPLTIFMVSDFIDQTNYLTSDQLKTLAQMENVEIGGHGKTHTPLTSLSSQEWKKELRDSKEKLERCLNKKIYSMSFPHGKYNAEMIAYALELGFLKIATSDSGLNVIPSEAKIKRTAIFKYDNLWIFRQKIYGLWDKLH